MARSHHHEVVAAARKLGINPVELQLNRADNLVQSSIYFGLEVRCADRPPKVIPFIDFRNPEYEIATAFASLAGEKTIAFLTARAGAPPKFPGFNMPTPPERIFEGLREKLRSLYKVIDLGNTKYGDPIPDEVDVLVLGRPTELTERERFEIDQFLMRGGRILVLYDTQVYETGSGGITHKTVHTGVEPLLAKWGIAIPDDVLVVDRMCETVRVTRNTPVGPRQQQIQYPYFPAVSKLTGGLSTNHPITKVLQGFRSFGAIPSIRPPIARPASRSRTSSNPPSDRSARARSTM